MYTARYAIKTGRRYTLVSVDPNRNQCRVALEDGPGYLTVSGTGEAQIKAAATDGAGESFATLKAMREAHGPVTRRLDLDC